MKIEAINEFIRMVRRTPYFGIEIKVLQTDVLKVALTGITIIPSSLIEEITAICRKHDLQYYYRVSLDSDNPEVMIFEDDKTDNPF